MRRIVCGMLIGSIVAAPTLAEAHGGRGGGGSFGGGHAEPSHAMAHAPTFSHPTESFQSAYHPSYGGSFGGGVAHEQFAHSGAWPAAGMHSGGYVNHPNWNTGGFGRQGYGHNPNFGYRPNYYGSWYHGSWGGNYGYPWGYRPGGWGLGWGGFGLGLAAGGMLGMGLGMSSPYGWGYSSYYNPYYGGGAGMPAYANYSQPLMGAPQYASQPYGSPGPGGAPQGPQDQALTVFNDARDMFTQGNYQAALGQVNQALSLSPNDSVMQEFRASCLFAMQDYQQSAAALYAVLSSGPGWDWTTMSGLYPNMDVYAGQLRNLENFRRQNPDAAYGHFLLAYQYMLQGYKDQAAAELNAVVALQPKDQLSAQLLRGLTAPAGSLPPGGPSAVAQAGPPPQPINPAALAGNWQASRSDGSSFGLNLAPDNSFVWKFSQQGKQQVLTGKYTIADNYLILKSSDQNSLVGQVAMSDPNRFNFRLSNDSATDPGLTFIR